MRLASLLLLIVAPAPLAAQPFCTAVEAEPLVAPTVVGNGTPGSISSAALQAALDVGGPILLDQGPTPSTVVLTQTLVASRPTVLDGGGLVSLSGGARGAS